MHKDFTDYASLSDILGQTNTVMWGLGTTSIGVDDATYTVINVDFPVAFVTAWLAERAEMLPCHFTMSPAWAQIPMATNNGREKKAEQKTRWPTLAQGTGLRTFSYRSAFVRPTSEQATAAFTIFMEALHCGLARL